MAASNPFTGVTPEQVGIVIANAEQFLAMAKMVAALTPTAVDDSVVDAGVKILAVLKPYAAQPWFIGILDMILSYLRLNGTPEVKDFIEKFLSK